MNRALNKLVCDQLVAGQATCLLNQFGPRWSKSRLKCRFLADCRPVLYPVRFFVDQASDNRIFEDAISEENLKLTIDRLKDVDLTAFQKRLLKKWPKDGNRSSSEAEPKKTVNASILVPFCYNEQHQPSLLFTVRSSTLANHRGEVSFPGGLEEAEDGNCCVRTSVRETVEELGVDENSITTYGRLNPVPGRTAKYLVHPVLGFINLNNNEFNLNKEEVESVFLVPLTSLCCPNNWRVTHFKVGYSMPVFVDQFRNWPRIWGLTALVVHLVMSGLLPKQYKVPVKPFYPIR